LRTIVAFPHRGLLARFLTSLVLALCATACAPSVQPPPPPLLGGPAPAPTAAPIVGAGSTTLLGTRGQLVLPRRWQLLLTEPAAYSAARPRIVRYPWTHPLSCQLIPQDDGCISCAKTYCCTESQACDAADRCQSLMRCARHPAPFAECVSDDLVGPPDAAYRATRACLSAHCPAVCPPEHGGPPR